MQTFLITCAAIIVTVLILSFSLHPQYGNVITQGIVPQFATSSTIIVGPQSVTTLFSRASNCSARIVSTQAQPVLLSFGGPTPAGSSGAWQGASTTVSYDNANYGCGPITAFGYSSSTVTISSFTQ